MVDIKKGYKEIIKIHKDLKFDIVGEDDECIGFNTDVVFDKYKGTILIKCTCFDEGTIHVIFTLDQMEKTFETLDAINRFNNKEPFFKMYLININHKKYLEVHYYSRFHDVDSMIDEYEFALDRFAEDREVRKQITELSNKTFTDEELARNEEQKTMN